MKERKYLLGLCLIFVLSRILYYFVGVRFDVSSLENYIQLIDPALLKNNLLESLFYLHVQPPLFNLFVGIILKIFPQNYPLIFHLIYLCVGLCLMLTLYTLMLRLNINKIVVFLLTAAFMVSPSVILYETWLYHSYLTTTAFCAAGLFLYDFLCHHKRRGGLVFCLLLTTLLFLHASFHLIWMLFINIIIFSFNKSIRKKFFHLFLIPFLICLALYVKNYHLTGLFTTSSMLGYHLATMTFPGLQLAEAQQLVDTKKVSKLSFKEVSFLDNVGRYFYENEKSDKTGIAVLDQYRKSTGAPNFNSIYHLKSYKIYLTDAKYVMLLYPSYYFRQVRLTFFLSFFPGPTDVPFKNRIFISRYENYYNFMFTYLNKINDHKLYTKYIWRLNDLQNLKMDTLSRFLYAFVILYYSVIFLYGCVKTYTLRKERPQSLPVFSAILFMVFNIVYITVISNLISPEGNNRLRFSVDPFYLCLLGLFMTDLINKRRREKRRGQWTCPENEDS